MQKTNERRKNLLAFGSSLSVRAAFEKRELQQVGGKNWRENISPYTSSASRRRRIFLSPTPKIIIIIIYEN